MNNLSIVGRMTKDVELSTTPTGIEFTRFNVAVPSEFKTPTGEKKADFFSCVAWRENAKNIVKFFKKGYPIGIVGSMNSRTYETADGTSQLMWEVNVKQFYFVGSFEEPGEENKSKAKSKTPAPELIPADDLDDDSLPF